MSIIDETKPISWDDAQEILDDFCRTPFANLLVDSFRTICDRDNLRIKRDVYESAVLFSDDIKLPGSVCLSGCPKDFPAKKNLYFLRGRLVQNSFDDLNDVYGSIGAGWHNGYGEPYCFCMSIRLGNDICFPFPNQFGERFFEVARNVSIRAPESFFTPKEQQEMRKRPKLIS